MAGEGELNEFYFQDSMVHQWSLCYYFNGVSRFARFPSVSTLIIPKTVVEAEEYPNLAFTFVEKKLTYRGEAVRPGDRVKFVESSCEEPDFNKDVTGLDYYTLDEEMSVSLLFTRVSNKLVLCYSFKQYNPEEPVFYAFRNDEYSMRAIGMKEVTVNRGDTNVVISGVHKSFQLSAVEVDLASFYFVEVARPAACRTRWRRGVFALEADRALVVFAGCFQDTTYRMCVNFNYNAKPYVADMYSQTLEIVTFSA